jgi:methyl-accepting chemotaxis protein
MSEDLVNKYEAQTTELYNKIDELNAELETTTNENRKQEINRQIEDANQKIKDIDEIINSANKVTEEVNAKLQELSFQKELQDLKIDTNNQMQAPREVG